jgi:hypothetical protein
VDIFARAGSWAIGLGLVLAPVLVGFAKEEEEEAVVVEVVVVVVLGTRIGEEGDDGMMMTELGRVVVSGERIRSRDRICPVRDVFPLPGNADALGK